MSKSADSPQGTILVLDDPKAITKKIKSAVTDSEHRGALRPDGEARRLEPARALRRGHRIERSPTSRPSSPAGSTATFKGAVADAVVEFLRPVRERYEELAADPAEVDRRLGVGADIAEAMAEPVLARAIKAAGLLPRPGSTASASRAAGG